MSFLIGIFGLIFKKFLNKKKKIAIYMSFILDALFLLVNILGFVELGVVLWLIVSNMTILLLHVLYTIKAMKQFDEACELQNFEEYDKKDLLNSLSKTIDLSIIGFLFIPFALSKWGLGFIYAFFVPVRIITGLLAFVTTIKEKKSLATFNILFATINIFFTFELLEIIFGICHLLTVTNYLNKEDENEE